MQKEADVYVPTFFHHMAIFPIFALVRTLIATIRFVPSKSAYEICSAPDRLVGIAWHRNIIFLAKSKIFFRPKLNMAGLVSASKDAAYLVAFFDFMGIKSVRGSYRRRGREAIGDLVEKLGSDSDVFITPDGQRTFATYLGAAARLSAADVAPDLRALGEAISGYLDTVSPAARRAFLRRYWYGDSLEDIARRYGYTAAKVKSLLHRTRKGLREHLIREGYKL